MKLLKNELIKSKIFLFIIVDICIQILVILAIKTYILDISAPYSELDYNKLLVCFTHFNIYANDFSYTNFVSKSKRGID